MTVSANTKLFIAGGAALLVLIVAAQNIGKVPLRFLFWSASVDRLILIPFLFLCGVGVGMLLQWGIQRKGRSPRA